MMPSSDHQDPVSPHLPVSPSPRHILSLRHILSTRRSSTIALLALLILAVVFFWKVLFLGEVAITYNLFHEYPWRLQATEEQTDRPSMNPDCVQSYYPRRDFATRTIRSGEIPLWNPYDFCGAPFLANVQSGVFYPVNLILYPVDPLRAMGYYLFFHFLLAAVFMFLFLRSQGLSAFASFSGGIMLMLCGYLVTRTGHPTFVATAAWVPGVLWCTDRLFRRPGPRAMIWLGFCHAGMVLAGFPQTAFHGSYALAAYALYRAWSGREMTGRSSWRTLGWVAGAMVISGAVAFVQILPTYEFIRFCTRRFFPYESILSSAHHPAALIKYLVPGFLGDPLDGTVWSTWLQRGDGHFSQNYVSTTGYIGILPLLLAWVGLFTRRKGVLFFAGMAVVTLLIVFGTPLLRIAYPFPGFNFSRIDRIIYFYMLAMGCLAAWGISGLEADRVRGKIPVKRTLIPILFLLVLFWAAFAAVSLDPGRVYAAITRGRFQPLSGWEDVRGQVLGAGVLLALAVATIGLRLRGRISVHGFRGAVLILLLVDLFAFGYPFNISRPHADAFPQTPVTDALKHSPEPARVMRLYADILFPNTGGVYGISDAQGYNALTLDYYMELMERVQPGTVRNRRISNLMRTESIASPIVDMLSVDQFLALDRGRAGPPFVTVVPNEGAMPRAFLVSRAETVADGEVLLDRLASPEFDPARSVYLTPQAGAALPEIRTGLEETGSAPGTARITSYRSGEVTLEYRSDRDAWLVLAETYYPGWKAWLNDEPATVWRANYVQRAVFAPAGKHTVTFRYEPMTFRIGAAVSLVALALGVLGLVTPTRGRGDAGTRRRGDSETRGLGDCERDAFATPPSGAGRTL